VGAHGVGLHEDQRGQIVAQAGGDFRRRVPGLGRLGEARAEVGQAADLAQTARVRAARDLD
jgi:hypothetical protein